MQAHASGHGIHIHGALGRAPPYIFHHARATKTNVFIGRAFEILIFDRKQPDDRPNLQGISHFKALPLIPYSGGARWRERLVMVMWSTESKAAEKSRQKHHNSLANMTSLNTQCNFCRVNFFYRLIALQEANHFD